jgi:hypothetical protein
MKFKMYISDKFEIDYQVFNIKMGDVSLVV